MTLFRVLFLPLFCLVLSSSCSTNEQEGISGTIVFNAQVETPHIEQARIQLLQFNNHDPMDLTTLAEQTLDAPEASSFDFSLDYTSAPNGQAPFLAVQLFFSSSHGEYRRSFSKQDIREGEHIEFVVERPILVNQDGFFEQDQTYIHHLFETDEACHEVQKSTFVNCVQWMNFDNEGRAEVVVTDIANSGTYQIEGEQITVELLEGSGDVSGSVSFTFALNKQLFLTPGNQTILWTNMPDQ